MPKHNGHYHCEDCEHCFSLHGVNPEDVNQIVCAFCEHTERHCFASPEIIQKILFYQYVHTMRDIIEEVGI